MLAPLMIEVVLIRRRLHLLNPQVHLRDATQHLIGQHLLCLLSGVDTDVLGELIQEVLWVLHFDLLLLVLHHSFLFLQLRLNVLHPE